MQGFDVAGRAGDELLVNAADSIDHPVRINAQRGSGKAQRLDRFNDKLLARIKLGKVQEITITGALGDAVQMWLVHPPAFDPRKKYPLLHVIHGGPYAAAGDTYR